MLRWMAVVLCVTGCAASTLAQSQNKDFYSKIDLFAGYSANGYFVNESTFSATSQTVASFFSDRAGGPKGFEVSVGRRLRGYFSLKGDFSAYFDMLNGHTGMICQGGTCQTGQAFRVPLRSFYFLGGPEFRLRNRTRFTPFAHTLFGGVYSNASFTTNGRR